MIDDLAVSLVFYYEQILTGAVIGMLTAVIGVFVILRKMIFAGVALSQAASSAVVLTLLLEIHSEPIVFVATVILFSPFYLLQNRLPKYTDAVLAAGLVFFAALGQVLMSFGGNASNHLVTAFFGNILTMPRQEWHHLWLPAVIGVVVFVSFYRSIILVSFDRIFARTTRVSVVLVEFVFFSLLTACLTTAIYLMGSFYSIAHLVIPGLIGLWFSRSIKTALVIAAIISFASTIAGFTLSLIPIQVLGTSIHLPTSSTVILIMSVGLLSIVSRLFLTSSK
ncbi:MAG: metal ABC transporter permease [Leptonema sp. (in: Bacteria)]|nr:metal ABC transporter permease [Leptonema sp. (in: bacteria)]